MKRSEKEAVVKDMTERLDRVRAVVLTDFRGLKVEQMTELRHRLREQELEYVVVKNTLLKRAAEGKDIATLLEDLDGPNGVAMSYGEPVDLAKVLVDFAKDNPKLELKQGFLEGQVIDSEQVKTLAKLPSRDVLMAQVLGCMNGVPRNFVSVMAAVVRGMLNVLKAIEEQKASEAA